MRVLHNQDLWTHFLIFRKSRGGLPFHSWFNTRKCGWIFIMCDRILKMPQVINKPGFWIWHSCICKGYEEFRMFFIMAPYASVMPKYALICLDVPQYAWTRLNIAECPWIGLKWKCLNKLFRLGQDSQYAAI